MTSYMTNLAFYVPELIVVGAMILLLFIYAFSGGSSKKLNTILSTVAAFILVFVGYLQFGFLQAPIQEIFSRSVVIDQFGTILKMVMVVGTLGVIYMAMVSQEIVEDLKFEFIILVLGVLVGAMLLVSATSMITIYVGLETISIISYALSALKKNDDLSAEAGLKYVLYGGFASGVMLFGMSHIYGVLGTLFVYDFPAQLASLTFDNMLVLVPAFLMFFVGLGYKISAVPFHMWTPDVYEGSPVPVTTFFAIVPKVAALGALYRLSTVLIGQETILATTWITLIGIVGALTMTVGNIAAIGQRSVKRMLAYSSISHAGFIILATLVVDQIGSRSLVFYAIVYLFMTLVAFMITGAVSDKYGNDYFDRFRGLILRYPLMAISMVIIMLSLAGIPPLAGFVAKFNILAAIIKEGYYTLAVIAGLNSVISLYYYMKIVRLMVLKEAESTEDIANFSISVQSVVIFLTIPVVFLGIFWETILAFANGAQIFIK